MRVIPLGHGKYGGRAICNITGGEYKLIEALKTRGSATVRELADDVYGSSERAYYSTVQMLLGRLQKKGYVKHNGEERPKTKTWSLENPKKVLGVLSIYATNIINALFSNGRDSTVTCKINPKKVS